MSDVWKKSEDEIERLRVGGKKLAEIMEHLKMKALPGVSTGELGAIAEKLIVEFGAEPIFKGYGKKWGAPPFPAAICISLNEEVVHGIPRLERILKEGDLLKLDIGMRYRGLVTDMARTVRIGGENAVTSRAMEVDLAAKQGLEAGIAVLRDGAKMEDYAGAVENVVKKWECTVVRDLVGHGVGRELHEDPQVPNYTGSGLPNFTFREGMVVALEPMVNAGDWKVQLAPDGWTFVSSDRSLSAHWENTVLITKEGAEVLTTA